MRWRDLAVIVHHEQRGFEEELGLRKPEPVPPTFDERVRNRLTSWTKRFSPSARAIVATPAPPREFWMTSFSPAPPVPPPVTTPPPSTALPAEMAQSGKGGLMSALGGLGLRGFHRGAGAEPQDMPRMAIDDDDIRLEPFFGPGTPVPPAPPPAGPTASQPSGGRTAGSNGVHRAAAGPGTIRLNAQRILSRMTEAALAEVRHKPEPDVPEDEFALPDITPGVPPLDLLRAPPPADKKPAANDPALMKRASELMEVLGDFGVKGRISGIYPGPVITLFELEPARGTKSSRVVGLADDIARSMSAVSARVAVVPGRDAIGIELPNPSREIVALRAILESQAYEMSQAALPLALGKSIGGEPVVVDLARMPHLLVAGTTGSGKSVGINTMILSLVYRLPPSQCKFILIDPKMLELSVYDGIPHLLAPVVTEPKKAVAALKWTVREMNERYEKMCKLGVRNVSSYNAKAAAAQLRGQPLKRRVQTGFDRRSGEPVFEEEILDGEPMPYIVVVIDEMADLMMVAGKEIEIAVQRLSQMARAAGIHLIMATQRPSVDVVTGTIKANFPSRISFQVTSKIDSRTIIGEMGAEQLLGSGDMLYMAAGGRIMRAHGPFVSDEEVERVAAYLKTQGVPDYREDILDDGDAGSDDEIAGGSGARGGADLYDEAVSIVLRDRKPTTSYLQRRLGIGYNRAASLIERMETEGVIGAPNRTGRREILIDAMN
jgi:S-DNA-T family DNA segregation ATPase FtsK/SpoIIIE